MTVPVRITSLARVSAPTPSGQAWRVELNNGRILENVHMADIATPQAFTALLKSCDINAAPVCEGATGGEKQRNWNAQLKPLLQACPAVEAPRWKQPGFWKQA